MKYDFDNDKSFRSYTDGQKPMTVEELHEIVLAMKFNSEDLYDGAVKTEKIADFAVDYAKIAAASIGETHIRDASINNAMIKDLAVSRAKIAEAAIGSAQIADLAVTNAKINNIDATKITSGFISSERIESGSITADHIDVTDIVIGSANIDDASILTAHIADGQIDRAKIIDGEITNAKIANGAIESAKIGDAQITTAKIKQGAITSALIEDGAINSAQIADASITDAKIVELDVNKLKSGTIDTTKISIQDPDGHLALSGSRLQVFDNQTTPVERVSIGDVNNDGSIYGFRVRGADGQTVLYDENGVYNEGITDGAITNPKIGDGEIDNRVIHADTITGDKLVVDAITGREIKAESITANHILSNSITADEIDVSTIEIGTANIADGAITNAKLGNVTIDYGQIANVSISSADIQNGAITTAKIGNAQITSAKIDDLAVTGAKIDNATIGTAKIVDGAITNAKIGDAEITNAKIANIDASKITTGVLDAERVRIGSSTSFDSGFDPTTKATPSDVSSAETRAKNHADSKASTAESNAKAYRDLWAYGNTTYIDGGNIYANSITANQIKAGEITSEHISSSGISVDKISGLTADKINFDGHVFGTNATFAGSLKAVTGTFGDVTVNDGDFNLQDEVSSTRYTATPKRNMIKDHSFELIPADVESMSSESITHNWLEIMPNSIHEDSPWERVGSPKVATIFGPDSVDALAMYGEKAIVVRDANYVRQYVYEGVGAGSVYTVSAFFKRQWKATGGGIPRIEIWHVGADLSRKSKIVNSTFSAVKNDYSKELHATTFTVPSTFEMDDALEVIISGGNDRWVQCDGVQMVIGTTPSVYDPEDSIWEFSKGNYRPINKQRFLWGGTIYPRSTQTIYPDKKLNDCINGWILQWQGYTVGGSSNPNNYEYTHIPKSHLTNSGTGIRVILGTTNGGTFDKYIYVTNEYVTGHDNNDDGGSQNRVLTAVYEY